MLAEKAHQWATSSVELTERAAGPAEHRQALLLA